MDTLGQSIAHYNILEKLGEGGMGVVYKALDTHLDRLVAIKVLPPEKVADPERKRRFVQEAKAASALNHPNIITIHDISQEGGIDFLVMEFVPGRTLEQLIPRKGLRLGESLNYAVQIADALATAHAAGIVHRDLKPGNIMVTGQGLVKVLDFGLAKLTEPVAQASACETVTARARTEEGTILGSAAYMSPEQAEGKSVDARSDIFSFGAMLYEMITGRRAFQGDSKMSTLAAVMNLEPKPVGQIAEGVPREFERLVARCLRKDLNKRAQHMADVKLALEEMKQDSDSGALEASATPGTKRAPRRLWPVAAVALGIAVLAVAGWWWRSGEREVSFEPVPLTTLPGSEDYPSFSPDGNQVAFAWNGERQDQWNVYIKVIGGGPALRLTTDDGYHGFPVWSPDGRSIAFSAAHQRGRSGIFSIPALGGPERLLVEGVAGETFGRINWSPDGKWISFSAYIGDPSRDRGIILVSTETGERRELARLDPALGGSRDAAFSPDGRRLAYVRSQGAAAGELYVVGLSADMKPEGQPRRITFGNRSAVCPVWTADGREIVFIEGSPTSNSGIARVTPDGKGRSRSIPGLGSSSDSVAISRQGTRLAFSRGGWGDDIYRIDLSGKEAPRNLISSSLYETGAEYAPDGKRIVFSSNRSGSREIWVADADGSNAVQLTHFGGPVAGTPRWSPEGRRIAFDARPAGNPDIYVIQAEGGAPRRLTDQTGEDARPAWSPDGKWIYFSSDRTGRSEIWRMPSDGGEAVQITKNGAASARPTRDGQELYYAPSMGRGPLRRMRLDGGESKEAVSLPVHPSSFTVTASRLYFLVFPGPSRAYYSLQAMSFRDGKISELAKLDFRTGMGLSLSPDERYALVTRVDESGTDLMLVENFR